MAKAAGMSVARIGELHRVVFKVLLERPDGLPGREVTDRVQELVPFTDYERGRYASSPYPPRAVVATYRARAARATALLVGLLLVAGCGGSSTEPPVLTGTNVLTHTLPTHTLPRVTVTTAPPTTPAPVVPTTASTPAPEITVIPGDCSSDRTPIWSILTPDGASLGPTSAPAWGAATQGEEPVVANGSLLIVRFPPAKETGDGSPCPTPIRIELTWLRPDCLNCAPVEGATVDGIGETSIGLVRPTWASCRFQATVRDSAANAWRTWIRLTGC